MKLRKLAAGIIPMMMVLSSSVSLMPANAGDGSLKVEVSSAVAEAGSDFTLTVSLSNIPETGIQGADFAVSYDSSLVSLKSAEAGPLTNTGADAIDGSEECPNFAANIEKEKSAVCVFWGTSAEDSKYWMQGEGVMLTITGTVLDTASPGSVADFDIIPVPRNENGNADSAANSKIWLGYYSDITAAEGSIIFYDVETVSGTVTVSDASALKGDANLDGKVNVSDVICVSAYVSNATKNPLPEQGIINADVYNTGDSLSANDAFTIQQYSSGIIRQWP